jgi:flagellar hook-length control protein FliK
MPATRSLPGVASQLVTTISPFRQAPNGAQTVSISLHPAELGEVHVAMNITDGQMTVRLIAATPEGAAAIRSSLSDLQSQLSSDGQHTTVFLDGNGLSSGQQGAGQQQWSGTQSHESATGSALGAEVATGDSAITTVPSTPSATDHLIDVRI